MVEGIDSANLGRVGHVVIEMPEIPAYTPGEGPFTAATQYVEAAVVSTPGLTDMSDGLLEECMQLFSNIIDEQEVGGQSATELTSVARHFLEGGEFRSFRETLVELDLAEVAGKIADGPPTESRAQWLIDKLTQAAEATGASWPSFARGFVNTVIAKIVQYAVNELFKKINETVDPEQRVTHVVAIAALLVVTGFQLSGAVKDGVQSVTSLASRAGMTLASLGTIMSLAVMGEFKNLAPSLVSLLAYVFTRDSLNSATPVNDNAGPHNLASLLSSIVNFGASQAGISELITWISSSEAVQNPLLKESVIALLVALGVGIDDAGAVVARHVANPAGDSRTDGLAVSVDFRVPSAEQWVAQMENGGAPRYQFISAINGASQLTSTLTGTEATTSRSWFDAVVPAKMGMLLYPAFVFTGFRGRLVDALSSRLPHLGHP